MLGAEHVALRLAGVVRGRVAVEAQAGRAHRLQRERAHRLRIRLARHRGDDRAQQHEAEVRVGLLRPGREVERHALHVADHLLRRRRRVELQRRPDARPPARRVAALLAVPAAGVVQAHLHGDLGEPRVLPVAGRRRQVAEPREHAVGQLDPAFLDELEDGLRGEDLRHAGERDERVGAHRRARLQVGVAVAARQLELAFVRDRDRRARDAVRVQDRRDDAVERVEPRQCASGDGHAARPCRRRGATALGPHAALRERRCGGQRQRRNGGTPHQCDCGTARQRHGTSCCGGIVAGSAGRHGRLRDRGPGFASALSPRRRARARRPGPGCRR